MTWNRSRWILVAVVALLGLDLLRLAFHSPETPFLPESDLTWWAMPDPPSLFGDEVPWRYSRTFVFRPARSGTLEVAGMGDFTLVQRGGTTVTTVDFDDGWRKPITVRVRADDPVGIEIHHPRFPPVVGLGGEAAPTDLRVQNDKRNVEAVPAVTLFEVGPSLTAGGLLAAQIALSLFLAVVVGLCLRRPRPLAPVPAPGLWVVVAILAIHTLVAGWNLTNYPAERGLDAEGHQEAVRLLLSERAIPAPGAGWQTYHPPLFPMIAAVFVQVCGSPFGMQLLSAISALLVLLIIFRVTGSRGWRGIALVAFAPVLLITEVQTTNEVFFAFVATALIALACRGTETPRRSAVTGLAAAAALLTKYTAVPFLAGITTVLAVTDAKDRRRLKNLAAILAVAALLGGSPYAERAATFGDPFIGNWDDVLGHPYRQGPGIRTGDYFLTAGSALLSHPFRARNASLWDSLYVSAIADGFGRFISTDAQHAMSGLLAWLALPLAIAVLFGWGAAIIGKERDLLELISALVAVFAVAAMIRFNLLLPYWSTAKAVFLLGLLLPVAVGFERGRRFFVARGGSPVSITLDATLALYVVVSIACHIYR